MTVFASRFFITLAVCAFVAGSAGLASAAGPSPDPSPAAVNHQKSVTPSPAPAPAPAPVSPAPSVSAPVTAPKPKVKPKVKAPVIKKAPVKKPVKHPVAKATVKVPAPTPKPVAVPVQPAPVVVPPAPAASHSSSRVWLIVLGAAVVLAILGFLFWPMRSQLIGMVASSRRRLGRSLRSRPAIPASAEAEAPTKVAEADTAVPATPYVRTYLDWLGHK